MDILFLQLMVFGTLAAAGNVVGGLILFPSRLHVHYRKLLKYLLALGAGFMLAVTFFEILPKTIALWQKNGADPVESLSLPMALMLGGYLLTQFFEHTVAPHFHLGGEMHCDEHDHDTISPRAAYTAIGGLLIHTFFDGVSIAAASQIDVKVGLLVFLAVFLHKLPEGFTIGSMVIAAGQGFRQVMIATVLVGATTLIGVILYWLIGSNIQNAIAYAMPIAGGVTLYVAASDLIPETNHHAGKTPLVSIAVFAGVALFVGTQQLLHSVMEH